MGNIWHRIIKGHWFKPNIVNWDYKAEYTDGRCERCIYEL